MTKRDLSNKARLIITLGLVIALGFSCFLFAEESFAAKAAAAKKPGKVTGLKVTGVSAKETTSAYTMKYKLKWKKPKNAGKSTYYEISRSFSYGKGWSGWKKIATVKAGKAPALTRTEQVKRGKSDRNLTYRYSVRAVNKAKGSVKAGRFSKAVKTDKNLIRRKYLVEKDFNIDGKVVSYNASVDSIVLESSGSGTSKVSKVSGRATKGLKVHLASRDASSDAAVGSSGRYSVSISNPKELDAVVTISDASGNVVMKRNVYYYAQYREIAEAVKEIKKKKKITDSSSDIEKAKGVAEWVGENIAYDAIASGYSAGEVLKSRSAICYGYAKAYRYLMVAKFDVPCREIANNGIHAWNQVKIDGEWYNVDAGWIDSRWDPESLGYFLVSSERLSEIDLIRDDIRGCHDGGRIKTTGTRFDYFTFDESGNYRGWWHNSKWKSNI